MSKSLRIPWLTDWIEKRTRLTVPMLRLSGTIGAGSPLRPGLSLAAVNDALERAFAKKGVGAVAIVVNSPGGSPVQSALIHDRIRQLAGEKEIPVIVFCEDVAASGGYWLALAGDEIYADDSSIIGSIGVIAMSFGFVEAIGKLGIERRVYTAGENKSFLDPFQTEDPEDVERLKALQTDIHEAFKAHVRARRGEKLKEDRSPDMFTGAFWTGGKAKEIGLIDGIGHMHQVLRDRFGDEVRIRPVDKSGKPLLRRLLMPGTDLAGRAIVEDALDALHVRAFWNRFGLW